MSLSSIFFFFCYQQKYFKTISLTLNQRAALKDGAQCIFVFMWVFFFLPQKSIFKIQADPQIFTFTFQVFLSSVRLQICRATKKQQVTDIKVVFIHKREFTETITMQLKDFEKDFCSIIMCVSDVKIHVTLSKNPAVCCIDEIIIGPREEAKSPV